MGVAGWGHSKGGVMVAQNRSLIASCVFSDSEKMAQYLEEERHMREENLRLQRKLQREMERREALCRQLSESESSLEMDDERFAPINPPPPATPSPAHMPHTPSITPVPGDPVPSSVLHGHQACPLCTGILAGKNSRIHKLILK